MQHNDDPELWADLKRKEVEYDRRRNKKVQYFESVRHAQTVQIDDIPLPQMGDQPLQPPPLQNFDVNAGVNTLVGRPSRPNANNLGDLQIPPEFRTAKPTIGPIEASAADLKDTADDSSNERAAKNIPGCPPGPPPMLRDLDDLDSDYESDENEREPMENSNKGPSHVDAMRHKTSFDNSNRNNDKDSDEEDVREPTSIQKRILAIAGQKFDDFMKELENVRKKKDVDGDQSSIKYKEKSDTNIDSINSSLTRGIDDELNRNKKTEVIVSTQEAESKQENVLFKPQNMPPVRIPPPMKLPNPPPPPMGIPPAMMFRPPPMRPGLQSLGIRMPPGMGGIPRLRMPPGPPPGIPPARMSHPPFNKSMHPNVSIAMQKQVKDTKGMTTISAKPQIRNLSADVTRFVPSTLRVKREDKKVPKKSITPYSRHQSEQTAKAAGTTKDDAYMQFMQEMQGLL